MEEPKHIEYMNTIDRKVALVKRLISRGKLKRAVRELGYVMKHQQDELLENEFILLSATCNTLLYDFMKQTITYSTFIREKRKLFDWVLNICNELRNSGSSAF